VGGTAEAKQKRKIKEKKAKVSLSEVGKGLKKEKRKTKNPPTGGTPTEPRRQKKLPRTATGRRNIILGNGFVKNGTTGERKTNNMAILQKKKILPLPSAQIEGRNERA